MSRLSNLAFRSEASHGGGPPVSCELADLRLVPEAQKG